MKGKMMKKITTLIGIFLFSTMIFAQAKISLKGLVIDSMTRKPVDMATVMVLETKTKTYTDEYGRYSVSFPSAGTYTLIVKSDGNQIYQEKIVLSAPEERNIVLKPLKVQGGAITIKGERDIQKTSRYTMTVKELKEVPASFGDSISALTSLPNVTRTDGFFGPLVIRGSDPNYNGYFIDGIPIYSPYHFGGLHSVINNNLMSEIDLYSSAFPAHFGYAQGAVININTVDDVKRTGGYADISLLSSAALVQTPFLEKYYEDGKEKTRNKGYFIVSGRIGYLSVFAKTFQEVYKFFGNEIDATLPYYGDYQIKFKYFLNDKNSLTFLAFGSYDKIDATLKDDYLEAGDDPLWADANYYNNLYSHGQGLTHTYTPNDSVKNTLLLFNSLQISETIMKLPKSYDILLAEGINPKTKPLITGLKESISADIIKDHFKINAGAEITHYYFRTSGTSFNQKEMLDENAGLNPGEEGNFELVNLGYKIHNQTVGGFAESKINVGWIEFIPGVRADHLFRTNSTVVDPRGMIAFNLPTNTSISFAGGRYSYFVQTSSALFHVMPHIAKAEYIDPMRAYHSSAGIEQKFGDYSIKAEGFYNVFKDDISLHKWDDNGTIRYYDNVGELRTRGVELMLKKDIKETENGFYGWISYTLDKSQYKIKSMTSDPENYDEWFDSAYDMKHVLKLVAAYKHNRHTISARFQYNTASPSTPIVAGVQDTSYVDPDDPNHERWVPVSGERNSKRLSSSHRLDIRYSYKQNYEWGYFTWYAELINATNTKEDNLKWDYRYGYSSDNPKIVKDGLPIIPNFGVEIKF
ncbi:MAG TPA: carboxypeptidase-like regulatory domain-containing protein [Spirochaetota bacterium]|nr:carboxypeptidase-like regulatory domain-containing protein [Spirochaetota bacterium]HPY03341.1 carboxypeptidase-like regulatory domain-containing protein [Spirochaetota bacterium]HQA52969.1 carboxypeptidase-like regulatory domain-containing protein [Spirochaetota bacterium]